MDHPLRMLRFDPAFPGTGTIALSQVLLDRIMWSVCAESPLSAHPPLVSRLMVGWLDESTNNLA